MEASRKASFAKLRRASNFDVGNVCYVTVQKPFARSIKYNVDILFILIDFLNGLNKYEEFFVIFML